MAKISADDRDVYLKTALLVAIPLLLFGGWLLWTKVYMSKQAVFNAMLNNSLNTYGVTKTVKQNDQSGKLEQVSQAQFGAQNTVEVKTTINQPTVGGDAKVITETIATPTENYVRYTDIQVPVEEGKPAYDFSTLKGQWGRVSKAEGGNSIFSEAVFGVVLFGNLPEEQRVELTNFMKDKQIYKVDFSKVEAKNEDGHSVYVYPVDLNTKNYVQLVKKYDEILGLKLMEQLDPEAYSDSETVSVKLHVDKQSRNLVQTEYPDGGREEKVSGYGIRKAVTVPAEAVERQDLEDKLQKLLGQ